MSAAHRGSDAAGVLDGPARTGHFNAGRPDPFTLARVARTSGDDEAGLGNYVTVDTAVVAASDALASQGLRVLAVARRELDGPRPAREEAESALTLLGLRS